MGYLESYFSLEGKTALVTGPGTGIGKGIAEALAKAGADIIGTSHTSGLDETKRLIEEAGRTFTSYQLDMGNLDEVEAFAKKVPDRHQIDILVNNAGTIRREKAADFSRENWEAVINVNLNSLFLLTQAIGRQMIERKQGKIINIASLLSFQGGILVPAYTASKHAVAGLTKSFANEWAAYNVQVNAIAPGYIATNNTKQIRDDQNRNAEILKRIPAERWGQPDDIAGAAVFLSSPASDYVNGHVLAVDGGWLAR
ncbi:2-dehydro-3-deoxy-D-gluconate 5-dehydrogenase KduD [Bacillus licheniformis]|uniref:2-dehydro-3-deoxy-D-gluconate 5-dehydrogenase KduD n=1 Tax=Bacillus licheniformis TaxID=1402 RepID=UPI00227FC410|nr:2-dehydro-3-deoxy-D-gluconate 5-dehydrogenase KduD [Bacillus licheniformis]MCY8020101.1 2-dehydro-3-deoxy-D-gluconate 5-dehydrogenase KduD [Bacillus licheniformis]MCY9267124.1 2-dehydro-3-deoxy-D-gluconate 5-dehydrogenase KduD [Bacillus licheniformis]MEC0716355.1 2-dehydro-3-deoxy-D-gluconate 5-dehydrogenase KduD [Bacillus licheniformis]MEC0792060.1 2-dehydro-3-deoxy-D-gluconate 5-dehydrogenase KduD [Bacillus licheniformis]MED4305320.1 2-dehydro-3-deoxy-D-gluconate 5-dehydrogenase KduD [Bac